MLDDVKTQLYKLTYQAYELIRVAVLFSHDEEQMQLLQPGQQTLLQDLEQWQTAFIPRWCQDKSTEIAWLSSNMLMYWGVCYIWLSTCTSPRQTAFDAHKARFATIINHAEQALRYSAECTTGQPVFTFETGDISPLYFCAIKCRDPILRRKALHLMSQAPRRESLWASVATERVIEKIIAIEEGQGEISLGHTPALPETLNLALPPEERRIHHVAVVKKEVVGGRNQRLALQLSKAAVHPDGSRKIVHENIWLEECTGGEGQGQSQPQRGDPVGLAAAGVGGSDCQREQLEFWTASELQQQPTSFLLSRSHASTLSPNPRRSKTLRWWSGLQSSQSRRNVIDFALTPAFAHGEMHSRLASDE